MKMGKLFEMMKKDLDEMKMKEFVISNGKTKPYCPVSFAECETEKTIKKLKEEGHQDIIDTMTYTISIIEQYRKQSQSK